MSKKRKKGKLLEKHHQLMFGENQGPKFGEVLKYHRKKQNLTQEETATGISCYSYLSKVENNVLEPNENFVAGVSKKLGVDFSKTQNMEYGSSLLFEIFIAYFYQDSNRLHEIRDDIKQMQHLPTETLHELALSVLEGKIDESEVLVDKLEPLIDNLDYYSATFFIILAATHYFNDNQLSNAYEVLRSLWYGVCVNDYIEAMKHEISFLVNSAIGLKADAMVHYNSVVEVFRKIPNLTRIIKVELHHVIILAEEQPEKATQKFDHIYKCYYGRVAENMMNYVKMLIKSYRNMPLTLEDYQLFKTVDLDMWYFKTMNLFGPSLLESFEQFETVNNNFEVHQKKYPFEVVRFRQATMDYNEQKEYINDIVLPMAIKRQDIPWINYYSDWLINALTENSRYKDAIGILNKRNKALQKIHSFYNK